MTYTQVTEEQIAKLPQWARDHIAKLEKNVAWYKEQLQAVSEADSLIAWEMLDIRVGIPQRAEVHFKVEGGTVECSLRDGVLRVHTNDGSPIIQPRLYNAVSITCKGWWHDD